MPVHRRPSGIRYGLVRDTRSEAQGLGVEVLFDCHDEHLIQNPETKEIVGCTTMIGEEEKTVKARKGVILCTGGFEFNEELKRKYLKCYPFKFEGWKYNTGDGIRMVEEVGGKLWHMDMAGAMYGMWTRDPENDFLILMMPADQTFIYTDRLGKRWVDETRIGSPHNGWHAFTHFSDDICDYDHCPSWCVFDQTLFEAGPMATRQGDWFECGNFTTKLPDELRDWEGWSDDNQAEVDKGWIIKADTIEELAEKMKEIDKWMDADTLKSTIENWNKTCENGEDPEFHRSPETLKHQPTVLRVHGVSRLLLDPRRCQEERAWTSARRIRRTAHSTPVRRWQLRQYTFAHLRHHRRKRGRKHDLGPHLRTSCRIA